LLVENLLTREGHSVIVAHNSTAALAILKASPVALVITDADLLGVGGLTFTDTVRSVSRDVPILYLYARTKVSEIRPAAKGVSYLAKPFTPRSLLARVRRLLGPEHRSDRKR
jgi:OmpR-family two-component system manganese-sensing response regulator